VLADAVLNSRIPPGSVAYIDLDPVTNTPRAWAGRPPPTALAPVTVTGHDCGVDGEVLVTRLDQVAGSFPGGGVSQDGGGWAEGEAEVYVLASRGLEEDES